MVVPTSQRAAPDCAEYKRLVSRHLKTIAEWKRTFDSGEAWEKTVEMECAILEHCQKHGCQAASELSEAL
jgi:hypothetical protein